MQNPSLLFISDQKHCPPYELRAGTACSGILAFGIKNVFVMSPSKKRGEEKVSIKNEQNIHFFFQITMKLLKKFPFFITSTEQINQNVLVHLPSMKGPRKHPIFSKFWFGSSGVLVLHYRRCREQICRIWLQM